MSVVETKSCVSDIIWGGGEGFCVFFFFSITLSFIKAKIIGEILVKKLTLSVISRSNAFHILFLLTMYLLL